MDVTVADISIINDILFGLLKELENLTVFKNSAKDDSLADLLEEQWETHIANYNALLNLLHAEPFAQPKGHDLVPLATIRSKTEVHDMMPDIQSLSADDRLIAYSHFLAVSRAGREYGWHVFDVTYLPLAEYLEKTVHLYIHDARTLKAWIAERGYYLIQWASAEQVSLLQQVFVSLLPTSP